MAARSNTYGMKKEFEYYEITWEIENYFLATLKKNWYLSGPKISVGNPATKWKMSLKSENYTKSIRLQLERLDSGTRDVRVNWRVTLKNRCGVMLYNADLETNRVSTKFCCQETYPKEYFEKKFSPLDNTLIIFCRLIVSHEAAAITRSTTFPSTIRNLRDLYANREYDIVIKTKSKFKGLDRTINAHKAVLSYRSTTFKRLIDEGKNLIILELDGRALENVIWYFYTGKAKFISEPTISLLDCLLHLDVKEALQYYIPDYVKLKTNLDVHNYEIKWVIEKISGRTESTTITSPVWNDCISGTRWELQLQLERMQEYMRMSISAESKGNVNPMLVGYDARDFKDGIVCKEIKNMYLVEGDVTIKATVFQSEISQILSSLPDNKLYLIFKIQTLFSDTVSRRENRLRWSLSS